MPIASSQLVLSSYFGTALEPGCDRWGLVQTRFLKQVAWLVEVGGDCDFLSVGCQGSRVVGCASCFCEWVATNHLGDK